MWADVAIGVVSCGAIIAAVWVSNSYYLPENLARQYAEENGHRLIRREGCRSRSGFPSRS